MPTAIDMVAGQAHKGIIDQDNVGLTAPVFDGNKVTVIFVLGGPGAGTISLFPVRHLLDKLMQGKGRNVHTS
jgi:hypothetical protein